MGTDPIIAATTIQEFIIAINKQYGTNIPSDGGDKKLLSELMEVKVTVTAGDGKTLLYRAQADTPSAVFGLAPAVQGTVILKFMGGAAQVVW